MKSERVIITAVLLMLSAISLATPPAGYSWSPVSEFTDEFNGTSLDSSKWRDYHPYWSGRNSTYEPANVSVSGGYLQLVSSLYPGSTEVNANTVTAACVSSQNRSCTPGYYEARILASDMSMTSAFWFQGTYSEIDVIENMGDASLSSSNWIEDRMFYNTHYYPDGWSNDIAVGGNWQMPYRSSSDFHTYGVWWKDENTIWLYHNDVKIDEITPGGPFDQVQYMFFDTEVFTWHGWPLYDDLLNPDKNTMYVDWVRAWTNNGSVEQLPYGGTARQIPGIIEAEEYDIGAEGYAYHDTTAGNAGGLFRTDDVDIEARDGGYNVGWIADGEWLEYTVDATTGTYDLTARVASTNSAASFTVSLDGTPIATVNVPDTTDWGQFEDVVVPGIFLTGGDDVILRIEFSCPSGGQNLNWIEFTQIPSSPYSGTPISLPGKLQAEEYDLGGEGIAYHDTTAGNTGNDFRTDDVDITDQYGGHVVAWVTEEEWLKYTVDAAAGTYDITVRASTGITNRNVTLTLDGNILGTINIPNMGWSTFRGVTLTDVVIPATGSGMLELSFNGGLNVDWIDFTLLKGDADFSGAVDSDDLYLLASQWLTDCLVESVCADLDYSGNVDLADFTILSSGWMMP